MTRLKFLRSLMLTVILAISLPACAPRPAYDEVTLQLKWLHQAQFAGFYAAEQNGYYAEEGIAVAFLEGGPAVNVQATVLDGRAQFGVAAADDLIVARAEGRQVQAMAVIYRRSPQVFVAAADSGIARPEDFTGQTILTSLSSLPTLHAMMARVGVADDQYAVATVPYDVELFASGETTVWGVYLTGSINILRQAGFGDLNIIFPDDYGVHFYADTLFASEDFLNANPELAARFLRATLRGWRWAVENPDEAGRMALEYDPGLDSDVQAAQMAASVPLVHTGEDQIGWMRVDVWEGMQQMLLAQGQLDEPLPLDSLYTMEFLHQVYGE